MDYLSFDLGASSGKMFRGVFDGERLALSPVHAFRNKIIPLAGGLYWDFPGIYDGMCEGIRKAMAEKPFGSFGIDSFNNDFSFIDEKGDLLFPLRSYRDPRTGRHQDAIYRKISARALYMHTGNQIAPFNTFMQLAAMREDGQGYLLDHADKLLFLPDLLGYYLTSRKYAEYSVASETQLLDWDSRDWIDDLLRLYDIPKRLFAPMTMPGTVIGNVSPRFLSQNGVPSFRHVAVCEHDTASAFLAAPASNSTAILSCGTWTVIGAENERPIINEYGYANNIANEGSLPGHHRISINVMGLWIMQQLRADYAMQGQAFNYEQIQTLARRAAPFAAFINPDHTAFYQPGEMAAKVDENRLKRDKQPLPAMPGALFRCVYESLAFQYRWSLEILEQFLNRKFQAISFVGGGARDEVLCQFTANALNLPVIAGPVDASSVGNILVQMLADHAISHIAQGREIVRRSFALREYLPQEPGLWQEQYLNYCALAHPEAGKL